MQDTLHSAAADDGKEQSRRLIAAELPESFIRQHGAVVVENHLNMILPTRNRPAVTPPVLAALLNSAIADQAFRCVNGSVAVSAYELESLPLPHPSMLAGLAELVSRGASRSQIEAVCLRIFNAAGAG